jgi:lipopolysaccharide export system protein LptC
MSLRENSIYFFLVVIALISGLLVKFTGIVEEPQSLFPENSPDYFSENYIKWEMNERGTVKNKLLSAKITHFSNDGTTHTVNPVMSFYNEKSLPWVVTAESAILSADGKDLLLQGVVAINREKSVGYNQLTINTRELKVKPETSYAETTEWAELISPPNKTTGIGMKMTYIEPINIELLANVQGNYETK